MQKNSYSATSPYNKLSQAFLIIALGFCVAAIYHYIQGAYKRVDYPLNTPLFIIQDHFADFSGIVAANLNLDPYNANWRGFGSNYPPGAYLDMLPFTSLGVPLGRNVYLFLFIACISVFSIRMLRNVKSTLPKGALVFGITFLSYPTLFNIDRLNTEALLVSVCLTASLLLINKYEKVAAVLFGIAAAAKIYPGIFLLIGQPKNLIKRLFIGAVVVGVITTAALILYDTSPFGVLESYRRSYGLFQRMIFQGSDFIQRSSSLYGGLRSLVGSFGSSFRTEAINLNLVYISYVISVLGLIWTGYLFIRRDLLLWEKFAICAALLILIPQTSFDYKLAYLYPGFLLFLIHKPSEDDRYVTWVFSLLFVSKHYIKLFDGVTVSSFLSPLLLVLLLFAIANRSADRKLVAA